MIKAAVIIIYCAGIYNIFLAIFHILFWKISLMNWKDELNRISQVNRGVMQVLNLCLIAIFIIMAILSFFHVHELVSTALGKTILLCFSIFWLLRLIYQFIFWKYSGLLFPILFTAGFLFYSIPAVILIFMF